MVIFVKRRAIAAKNKAFIPVFVIVVVVSVAVDGVEVCSINEEADIFRVPFNREYVELTIGNFFLVVARSQLILWKVRSVMNRTGRRPRSILFYNINLTFSCPLPVYRRVRSQKPKCRPESLTARQLDICLDTTKREIHFTLRANSTRTIIKAVNVFCSCFDCQHTVCNNNVVRLVVLQLIIAPSRDSLGSAIAHLDFPRPGIKLTTFEGIFPLKLPISSSNGWRVGQLTALCGIIITAATGSQYCRHRKNTERTMNVFG